MQLNVVYLCYSCHYGWPAKRSTKSNPLLPGSKRLHYYVVPPQRAYRPVSAHGCYDTHILQVWHPNLWTWIGGWGGGWWWVNKVIGWFNPNRVRFPSACVTRWCCPIWDTQWRSACAALTLSIYMTYMYILYILPIICLMGKMDIYRVFKQGINNVPCWIF